MSQEDSPNCEGVAELLFINCALHLLALSSQGQFQKHNVVWADMFCASMRTVPCVHDNRSFEIKWLHVPLRRAFLVVTLFVEPESNKVLQQNLPLCSSLTWPATVTVVGAESISNSSFSFSLFVCWQVQLLSLGISEGRSHSNHC